MKYIPQLTEQEIQENNRQFKERLSLYKQKGFDFIKDRKFILEKAMPLKGSILEIGTGTGHTTLCMAKIGYKFISIDSDKEILKIAALNVTYEGLLSNVKFYIMDAMSTSFGNNSFDNVVSVCLFHHISDINRIIKEIDRILTPGGKVIISDFNRYGMNVINAVHESEGRKHQDSGITEQDVRKGFTNLRYGITIHKHKGYWMLIGTKT